MLLVLKIPIHLNHCSGKASCNGVSCITFAIIKLFECLFQLFKWQLGQVPLKAGVPYCHNIILHLACTWFYHVWVVWMVLLIISSRLLADVTFVFLYDITRTTKHKRKLAVVFSLIKFQALQLCYNVVLKAHTPNLSLICIKYMANDSPNIGSHSVINSFDLFPTWILMWQRGHETHSIRFK